MVVGRWFARRRHGQETSEQGKVEHTARLLWEGSVGVAEFPKRLVERGAREWADLIQGGRVDAGGKHREGLELAQRMEDEGAPDEGMQGQRERTHTRLYAGGMSASDAAVHSATVL